MANAVRKVGQIGGKRELANGRQSQDLLRLVQTVLRALNSK